jgi:hypothetical protein
MSAVASARSHTTRRGGSLTYSCTGIGYVWCEPALCIVSMSDSVMDRMWIAPWMR